MNAECCKCKKVYPETEYVSLNGGKLIKTCLTCRLVMQEKRKKRNIVIILITWKITLNVVCKYIIIYNILSLFYV
jgi:uncharacterized OB-fold protein